MACSGLEVEPKPEQENNTLHSQSSFTKVQSNGIHKTIISSFETVKQTNKGLSESSSFDKISELSVCVDQQVAEELTQKKKQVAEELPCTSNIPSEKTTLCALHINKDGGCFKSVNSNKDLAQETSDITCTGMKENIVPTVNDTSTDLKSVEKIFSDFTIEKDCSEDSPTLVKEDDIIDHIVSASKGICYARYKNELQMPAIMHLITKDLSEPYSIYTYRYFIHNWPHLCFLAIYGSKYVGAIVCKLDLHKKVTRRGYIAMLAVDETVRRRKIGSTLVKMAIEAMTEDGCDEVVLETEVTNHSALKLYENLGFVRDKRLFRYYLNGVDALRLKLWLC